MAESADLNRATVRSSPDRAGSRHDFACWRGVLDAAADAVLILDEDGTIQYWNEAAVSLFGYERREILGKPIDVLAPEGGAAEVRARVQDGLHKAAPRPHRERFEFVAARKGGAEVPVEVSSSTWVGRDGALTSWVARDSSDRRDFYAHLLERHAELSAMFDHAPVLLVLMDEHRHVRKANRVAATFAGGQVDAMLGLRAGEALRCLNALDESRPCGEGRSCQQCRLRRIVRDCFETGQAQHRVQVDFPVNTGAGREVRRLLVSASPVDIGGVSMVLVSIIDVGDLDGGME